MQSPDICIAGAGLIGLSLALELHRRGAIVTVLERDTALSHASTAAAGMLAARDPENAPGMQDLAALSVDLYPQFLARIEELSGIRVPFQTSRTLQAHSNPAEGQPSATTLTLQAGRHHFVAIEEHSLDPRQLAPALLAAVRRTSIQLVEQTEIRRIVSMPEGVQVETGSGMFAASAVVSTLGAWSLQGAVPVTPRKGQMLSVRLSETLPLRDVVRTWEVYIVPRTLGPRAGTVLIGATIEDVGFDITTHAVDLGRLRGLAAELLPELGDEQRCPTVAQWAGLRPATPDGLPLLGALPGAANQFVAGGHYRDGILLAPATARVMADLLTGVAPAVDLAPFLPGRFV